MDAGKIFCNQCGAENSTASQFCPNCGAPLASALRTPVGIVDARQPVPGQAQFQTLGAMQQSLTALPSRYGGFWIRFVAAIIDGIVVQAVVMPVAFVIGLVFGVASAALAGGRQGLSLGPLIIGGVFGMFASWLYEALMQSSSRQATLGKMIFGMKVTDLQGNRISFAQATARHFAKYISGMILFLGYIMAGFTEKKQALHDMIAGTVVRHP